MKFYSSIMLFLGVIVVLAFQCCSNIEKEFYDTYSSYYFETRWDFTFKKDGSYILNTDGHLGNTEQVGKYSVVENSIMLHKDIEYNDQYEIFRMYFSNGILVDNLGNRYFKVLSEDVVNNFYACEIEFLDSLKKFTDSIIDNSDALEMARISGLTSSSYKFKFQRIAKINDTIYDVYGCSFMDMKNNEIGFVSSCIRYVDRNNYEVYQLVGDKLSVDDEFVFKCND